MSVPEENLLLRFDDEESDLSVVFDDDGRVAYAYLLQSNVIASEVWLYNHGEAPDIPEWQVGQEPPFKNSKEFVSPENILPIADEDEVEVRWVGKDEGQVGELYLRGILHAELCASVKPGHSKLTVKDGPLAKILR